MIVFDIEPLQNPGYKDRGIGRYTRNLLGAARKAGIDFVVTYSPAYSPPDVSRLTVPELFIPATRPNLRELSPDWLITTSPFERSLGATARLFRECHPEAKIATILYDLIPMVFERDYLSDHLERHRYSLNLRQALTSNLLMCISHHTEHDVRQMLDLKCPVMTIGTGVDEFYFEEPSRADDGFVWSDLIDRLPALNSPGMIFTISGGHRSKNLRSLLEAYASCPMTFRIAHPLVIGGGMGVEARAGIQEQWTDLLKSKGAGRSEIVVLPHLTDADIRSIYRRCRLFVYPSLYEGFGLPLAEAIVSGAVCIASHSSSLKEIMPLEDFSFAPMDIGRMAALIVDTCSNEHARNAFREWAAGSRPNFAWTNVGERFKAVLEKEGGGGESTAAPAIFASPSPRTAIIGPLPPSMSGVATYDEHILPHLKKREGTRWFASDGFFPIDHSYAAYPQGLLGETWQNFDRTVYVIGNSPHHMVAQTRLNIHPGFVWLHDVRLSGLAWDLAHRLQPSSPWSQISVFQEAYPGEKPAITSLADLENSPYSFARPLLRAAQGFIVHSQHAYDLLKEDLGGKQDSRPIEIIPLAVPDLAHLPKRERAAKRVDDPIKVGLVGFIMPIRNPEIVIDAVGYLARQGRPVSMEIVGNCPPDYAQNLRRRADGLSIDFKIHGYLETEEFLKTVQDLDVVIQIRRRTNGESSATISEALAMEIPVITNIPSVHEFWGDVTLDVEPEPAVFDLAQRILHSQQPEYLATLRERLKSMDRYSFPAVSELFWSALDRLTERWKGN